MTETAQTAHASPTRAGAAAYARPAARQLPGPTAESRAFRTGGRDGKLLIFRCRGCGRFLHPPRPVYWRCGGPKSPPRAASGRTAVPPSGAGGRGVLREVEARGCFGRRQGLAALFRPTPAADSCRAAGYTVWASGARPACSCWARAASGRSRAALRSPSSGSVVARSAARCCCALADGTAVSGVRQACLWRYPPICDAEFLLLPKNGEPCSRLEETDIYVQSELRCRSVYLA
jgi:hypothetical protein